jgi:hypothetical protein
MGKRFLFDTTLTRDSVSPQISYLSDSRFVSTQAMMVLTTSVYGAPPVFVLQPFLINNEAQPGTLRSGEGLLLTLAGERVLLMNSETHTKQQKEKGELKHYGEGSDESQDWKDEGQNEKEQVGMEEYYSGDYSVGKNTGQNQKIQEKKEDYDSMDYSVGTTYEEDEDYYEKSYEESKTEGKMLEESGDYHEKVEGDSEDYEKPEEYESNSQDGSGEQKDSTEETDVEKDESTTESESREGKSTHGNGNVENNDSGSDEKCQSYPEENGEYHNAVPDTESKRQAVKVISNHKDIKGVEHDGNAATDETDSKNNKLAQPIKNDQVKSSKIYVPEEIVIGYIKKSQTEYSKSQDATNTEGSQGESDTTDSIEATKLTSALKETEEVQLAPVVYHVSPKMLQTSTVQVTAV